MKPYLNLGFPQTSRGAADGCDPAAAAGSAGGGTTMLRMLLLMKHCVRFQTSQSAPALMDAIWAL